MEFELGSGVHYLMSMGREKNIQTGGQTNMSAKIIISLTPLPVQARPPLHSSFR